MKSVSPLGNGIKVETIGSEDFSTEDYFNKALLFPKRNGNSKFTSELENVRDEVVVVVYSHLTHLS